MRRFMHQIIVSITLFTFLVNTSYAQVQPIASAGYTARLNVAINGIVKARLTRWGFAANDPRIAATSYGLTSGLSVVAGVAMAGGATVSWPALLVAAGISGLVAGAVKLAANKDFTWTFNSGGTVTAKGTAPVSRNYKVDEVMPPLVQGKPAFSTMMYDRSTNAQYEMYGSTLYGLATAKLAATDPGDILYAFKIPGPNYCGVEPSVNAPQSTCTAVMAGEPNRRVYVYYAASAPASSESGLHDTRPPLPPIAVNFTYPEIAEAIKKIPDGLLGEPLADELTAAAVNTAWKNATGDNIAPWVASDPITPGEVADWFSANPGSLVNVSDFNSPANSVSGSSGIPIGPPPSMPGGGTSPGTTPGTTPGTGTEPSTGTEPGTEPGTETPPDSEFDWGPNPGIGAPLLEDTPTARSILDPIFNIMPDIKGFSVPAHASVCPTGDFELYGKAYSINQHCSLMNDHRAIISACAMLMFSIAALFIVLRA